LVPGLKATPFPSDRPVRHGAAFAGHQIRPFKQSYKWQPATATKTRPFLGFSHTHFSGAGHSDLGDILVMPLSGDTVRWSPETPISNNQGIVPASHSTEHAEPGYYAVTLQDANVQAELTATERVGVHRYRFAEGAQRHLLIDLRSSIYNYPGKVLWSAHPRAQRRHRHRNARDPRWAPGRQLYFAMRFSAAMTGHALYNQEDDPPPYRGFKPPGTSPRDTQSLEGRGLEAVLDFAPSPAPLIVNVALSPVSEDNAIANMDAETPGFDFDGVRNKTQQLWRTELGRVELHASPAMTRSFTQRCTTP